MKDCLTVEMSSLTFKHKQRSIGRDFVATSKSDDELIGTQTKAMPLVGFSTRDSLTCIDIPSPVVAGILDFSLSRQTPRLHLNNYLSRKPWHLFKDSWFEINGQREFLVDKKGKDLIQPLSRLRRSHYINDINSSQFRILPGKDGLTLRVYFEADGKEIKGICRKCKIGNQDKRAADSDIKSTRGNSEPYVDVNFSISYVGDQLSLDVQSVKSVMKVDSNGILGWFNKIFTRKLNQTIERRVFNYIKNEAATLEKDIEQWIQDQQTGLPVEITSLTIQGQQTNVCFKLNLPDGVALLNGRTGADQFFLGDSSNYTNYYAASGNSDYALITNFNPTEGDSIYLGRCSHLYRLAASPQGLPTGTAIYTTDNELIGIVWGATNLSLGGGYFISGGCLI